VNRRLEARHQWKLALTLNPEEADAAKIRQKLISGLQIGSKLKAVKKKNQNQSSSTIGKRAHNSAGQRQPTH